MYSIDFDKSIIKGLELVDINDIFPHEKVISKKSSTLSSFLKSFNDYIIISSILCCSQSMVIIDGHHRFLSAVLVDPRIKVTALEIDLPIKDLLPLTLAYTDAIGNVRNK